jgi:fatty acid/phospholipid biosynthesis enzyme
MRLVLDAMGGDHAPAAPVEGALLFAREHPAHEVVLVGDLARLREPLARAGGLPSNVRLHPASQVVEMEDHPISAIRRKKDSSLRVGFELVRRGEAEALVSAGHSGLLRSAIERRGGLPEKLGALLLQPTFTGLKKVMDYAEYGGAPLLGIEGVGIVAHGRSSPRALQKALEAALQTAQAGLRTGLTRCIADAAAWLPARQRGKGATADAFSD